MTDPASYQGCVFFSLSLQPDFAMTKDFLFGKNKQVIRLRFFRKL